MAGTGSSTQQLHRRLRGMGRQWSLQTDCELFQHVARERSLACLHELSDCIAKAAGHLVAIMFLSNDTRKAQQQFERFACMMPAIFKELCFVLGFALHELGAGLQQLNSSGHLPEAITCQALDAINCICYLVDMMYQLVGIMPAQQQERTLHVFGHHIAAADGPGETVAISTFVSCV
jgi:hypothetical protein